MSSSRSVNNSRRDFLKAGATAIAGLNCLSLGLQGSARAMNRPLEDQPNTHNMMLIGTKAAFLSHLPMFVDRSSGPEFDSPHRFQVILEATFSEGGKNLTEVYFNDRIKNSAVKMYTLNPDLFVLSRVNPAGDALKTFRGNALIRGHLERGGKSFIGDFENPPTGGAFDVNVENVVHFREFDPKATKPAKLEYLLFGKGTELFLAHVITKPNDFDQIVSIKTTGPNFSDEELGKGMRVEFSASPNTSKARLKEKVKASGLFHIPGGEPRTVPVEVVREFYFEEGELFVPPTFDSTAEEKKSGFR